MKNLNSDKKMLAFNQKSINLMAEYLFEFVVKQK